MDRYPTTTINELKAFTGCNYFTMSEKFLKLFFSPTFSQEAIDALPREYRKFDQINASRVQNRAPTGFLTHVPPPDFAIKLAFWDFCRRRTPWGCHPAHLAAAASYVWRKGQVIQDLCLLYRRIFNREHCTIYEIAASMADYRQSPVVMEKQELDALNALPERLTVYRGGDANEDALAAGCSWTLDRKVAEEFSTLWQGVGWEREWPHIERRPVVIEKTIDRSEIIIMFLCQESEVVLGHSLSEAAAINRRVAEDARLEADRQDREASKLRARANAAMSNINQQMKQSIMNAFPIPGSTIPF